MRFAQLILFQVVGLLEVRNFFVLLGQDSIEFLDLFPEAQILSFSLFQQRLGSLEGSSKVCGFDVLLAGGGLEFFEILGCAPEACVQVRFVCFCGFQVSLRLLVLGGELVQLGVLAPELAQLEVFVLAVFFERLRVSFEGL